MAGFVDTNLLLYGANRDAPEHSSARDFLMRAGRSADPWYLSEGVIYEFLRVATHARVFPRPLGWEEAFGFLDALLGSERFLLLRAGADHWSVVKQILGELTRPAGNLFFDVRTAALMREHGIRRIYTTDTDFLQFEGIETINPLRTRP